MSVGVEGLIAIGRIVKAFGVRGDLIVRPMTDEPERFSATRRVFLGRQADVLAGTGTVVEETTIEESQIDGRGVRLHLASVPDRTAAEKSVGLLVLIPKEERLSLEDGRYYVDDLIGLTVQSVSGERFGTLADVMRLPGHDVYVVRDNGTEFMIPAVKEFIKVVDLAARTVTVELIEGMRG
ncbi:MAG: 16S rRNA processing protein RimM [Ignavibacteriae bacterium]|nr:16S rRNA processing protein RimM [Ignavibacteriota bacterium]